MYSCIHYTDHSNSIHTGYCYYNVLTILAEYLLLNEQIIFQKFSRNSEAFTSESEALEKFRTTCIHWCFRFDGDKFTNFGMFLEVSE